MRHYAVAILACLVPSCSMIGDGLGLRERDEIPMTPLLRGTQSGIGATTVMVARDEAQWTDLWSKHASRQIPAPDAPAVDFAKHMVVCVCLGTRPSAGWSVKVERAVEEDGALWLDVRETQPAEGAATAQMLTEPFEMVLLPQSLLRVDVRATR